MVTIPDNIFWHALNGAQAHLAIGAGDVRRYAPGYCPVAGFARADDPDLDALAKLCDVGEKLLCTGWHGRVPPGWRVEEESTLFLMVWSGPVPANDPAPDACKLRFEHMQAACALAASTSLPFGVLSVKLGDYFGYFDGKTLVAMAGERVAATGLREINAVCTSPEFSGQGMARRLVGKLVRRQLMRGETPFLHVSKDNPAAHALYRRMGFRDESVTTARVVSRYA